MEALIHHFKLVTEGFRGCRARSTTRSSHRAASLAATCLPTARRPAWVHFRDPSFVNLQSLREMSIGGYVADLIQNLGMLDPILGGVDR